MIHVKQHNRFLTNYKYHQETTWCLISYLCRGEKRIFPLPVWVLSWNLPLTPQSNKLTGEKKTNNFNYVRVQRTYKSPKKIWHSKGGQTIEAKERDRNLGLQSRKGNLMKGEKSKHLVNKGFHVVQISLSSKKVISGNSSLVQPPF